MQAADSGRVLQLRGLRDWSEDEVFESVKQLCRQAGLTRRDLVDHWAVYNGFDIEMRNASVSKVLLKSAGRAPFGKGTSLFMRESRMEVDLKRPIKTAVSIIENSGGQGLKKSYGRPVNAAGTREGGPLVTSVEEEDGSIVLWVHQSVAKEVEEQWSMTWNANAKCEKHQWKNYSIRVKFMVMKSTVFTWEQFYAEEERIKGAMGKGLGRGSGGGATQKGGKDSGKGKAHTAKNGAGKTTAGKAPRFVKGGDFSEELGSYGTPWRREDGW